MKIDHELEGLKEIYGMTRTIVHPPCCKYELDASMIKIEDVYEGDMGEDIVTYKCPVCKKQHASAAYRK